MNIRSLPRAAPHDDPFSPPPARPDLAAALDSAGKSLAEEDRAAAAAAERRAGEEAREALKAQARDEDDDRFAQAINLVRFVEMQKGRLITSRKGAATVKLIKRLADALLEDDAPRTYPEFIPNALGGRSALDLAKIEAAIAGEAAPPDERERSPGPDEGAARGADEAAAADSQPAP
jgi:hypothetical protein